MKIHRQISLTFAVIPFCLVAEWIIKNLMFLCISTTNCDYIYFCVLCLTVRCFLTTLWLVIGVFFSSGKPMQQQQQLLLLLLLFLEGRCLKIFAFLKIFTQWNILNNEFGHEIRSTALTIYIVKIIISFTILCNKKDLLLLFIIICFSCTFSI